LYLDPEFFTSRDVHLHIPTGSVPRITIVLAEELAPLIDLVLLPAGSHINEFIFRTLENLVYQRSRRLAVFLAAKAIDVEYLSQTCFLKKQPRAAVLYFNSRPFALFHEF